MQVWWSRGIGALVLTEESKPTIPFSGTAQIITAL